MPRPPTEKQKPRISVLDRRLQNLDMPFGEPAVAIRFKDPRLVGRWFNDDVRPGNIHRAKELGWESVTVDMVEDPDSIGSHTINPASQISRGPRGQEILMFMPAAAFHRIQIAKNKKNLEDMKDFSKEQQELLQAAAKKFGPEAAEFIEKHGGPVGSVVTDAERVPSSERVGWQPDPQTGGES